MRKQNDQSIYQAVAARYFETTKPVATIRVNKYGEHALEVIDNGEWKKLSVNIEHKLFTISTAKESE